MGTILRCVRCNGRMLVEYPYGTDHGYGWEATCIACGWMRYPDKPAAKPHAGISPTTTRRTRNTAPCLPDHDAAVREWMGANLTTHEAALIHLPTVAALIGCRYGSHVSNALVRLIAAGDVEGECVHDRSVPGRRGWWVRLVREAVV